jgi:hypothetical protein
MAQDSRTEALGRAGQAGIRIVRCIARLGRCWESTRSGRAIR